MKSEQEETSSSYERIFESSPVAIIITKGLEITYANPSWIEMYGYSSLDEVKGLAPLETFAPEWRAIISENIRRRSEGFPVPKSYEVECLKKDGSRFPIIMSLASATLIDGPVTVGFNIDISKRKQAEIELSKSEAKFRNLFENSMAGISETKPDGTLTNVNLAYARMYGYNNPEQMLAEVSNVEQLYVTRDERERVLELIRRKGRLEPTEIEVLRHGGEKFWVLVSVQPIIDSNGQLTGYQATHIDVTKRKLAEFALKESENKFKLAFMTGMDAFYLSTMEEGQIIEINDNFLDIFGYTRAEVIGKTSLELGLYDNPSDRSRVIAELRSAGLVRDMELQAREKSGDLILISLSASKMVLNNQSYLLGVIRNVTEQKRSQEILRKKNKELEVLFDASQELSQSLDLKEACRILLRSISRVMHFDTMMISSFNSTEKLIRCLYVFDKDYNEIDSTFYPPMETRAPWKGTSACGYPYRQVSST